MNQTRVQSSASAHRWTDRGYTIPLALCALVISGAIVLPTFFEPDNVIAILYGTSITLPVVLAMQALLIIGRFDLSLGAFSSLLGMVSAAAIVGTGSITGSLVFALLAGAACGIANGVLVGQLSLNPLIATLATMGIARSLSLGLNDGRIIAGLPQSFTLLSSYRIYNVPLLIYFSLLLIAGLEMAFRYFRPFRRLYAVGGNAVAADHVGIRVQRVIVATYAFAGMAAATVGVLQASRTLSASPLLFDDLPLEAIAACIIGGGRLEGGQGSMLGAAFGALVISSVRNIVVLAGIPVYWKDLVIGFLLIGIIGIDLLRKR